MGTTASARRRAGAGQKGVGPLVTHTASTCFVPCRTLHATPLSCPQARRTCGVCRQWSGGVKRARVCMVGLLGVFALPARPSSAITHFRLELVQA